MEPHWRGLTRGAVIGLALIAAAGLWFHFHPAPVAPGQLVRSSGEALIGGPFALTNHLGARVSDSDFRGQLMLVYFGYTFCPDVCPLDMARLSAGLDIFEERGGDLSRLQALFVTIDPGRDSPGVLAKFTAAFHPRLIGLTGSDEEIAAAAAAYKVFYARAPGGEADDYLMNHSSNIFVMGPDGRYLSFFSSLDGPEAIAERLLDHIGKDMAGDGS